MPHSKKNIMKTIVLEVNRPGKDTAELEISVPSEKSLELAVALQPCFSDAVDLSHFIIEMTKEDPSKYMTLDMKMFRKMSQTRGDEEKENTMIEFLHALLDKAGFVVNALGFPLGKDNEPICRDEMTIDINKK